MAITKIHPIKVNLKAALDYIENPDKTDDKMLVLAVQPFPQGKNIKLSPHVTHLSGHLNVHQPGISVCRFCKIMVDQPLHSDNKRNQSPE